MIQVTLILANSSSLQPILFIIILVFEGLEHDNILLQGDHVALLAAFTEMGLKLRVDMPEQAMTAVTLFLENASLVSKVFMSLILAFFKINIFLSSKN